MKFSPWDSNYRREHPPNKLYLPSDITIVKIYENFLETHPEMPISCDMKNARNVKHFCCTTLTIIKKKLIVPVDVSG